MRHSPQPVFKTAPRSASDAELSSKGGILDRIRKPGRERETEEEDEVVLLAKRLNANEQQLKTLQAQQATLSSDMGAMKETLRSYISEQRDRLKAIEEMVKRAAASRSPNGPRPD